MNSFLSVKNLPEGFVSLSALFHTATRTSVTEKQLQNIGPTDLIEYLQGCQFVEILRRNCNQLLRTNRDSPVIRKMIFHPSCLNHLELWPLFFDILLSKSCLFWGDQDIIGKYNISAEDMQGIALTLCRVCQFCQCLHEKGLLLPFPVVRVFS